MRRRAQSTVEFALAVPLFLLVLLAILDFSRLLFTYVSLTNGARELARVAAVASSQDSAAIGAFTAYTVIAGGADPTTDKVVVTVADQSCATDERQGRTCATGSTSTATCTLPLSTTCPLPSRRSAGGGYVQVDVNYSFTFYPLFTNQLAGVVDVSFMRPSSLLTTTARTYVE